MENVTKDFGDTRALNNIILSIKPNKINGLLGSKGAGKSTLLNLITARVRPTRGEIRVNGKNVWENPQVLSQIYYMSEQALLPANRRVTQLFNWTGYFYPNFDLTYAEELANKFGLELKKSYGELSASYKTICKIVLALASHAPIMILDEPILDLDDGQRSLLYAEIRDNYARRPKTIIISTHLIEEVSDLIEEVIIINYGEIVIRKSIEYLLEQAYTVSGPKTEVEKYLVGKKYIQEEITGESKSVTVLGEYENQKEHGDSKLNFSRAEIKKLVNGLTEGVDDWVEY